VTVRFSGICGVEIDHTADASSASRAGPGFEACEARLMWRGTIAVVAVGGNPRLKGRLRWRWPPYASCDVLAERPSCPAHAA
jgi:hypothetical protein